MTKHECEHTEIYEKIQELGRGGNAKVFRVKNNNKEEYALKTLVHNKNKEKQSRFIKEIEVMKDNCTEIDGIIPIYDFSCEKYWYTMPIAKPIIKYIEEQKINISQLILGIIQLCETLEKLHDKNISHRDIKPSNIYFYRDRFYIGDFGLVDFPETPNDFTRSDRGLGAIFTIAPEMKRNPKKADGRKADVFSLAKTMWMLLTNDEKGFDGVYNFQDASHGLHFIDNYKNVHLVEIEELLQDSTNNNPVHRPTIKEFKERLQSWLEIISNRNKSQASDWNFLNKQLFGLYPPKSSSWEDTEVIINILNTVANIPAYNHMLFHTGGGLDLLCAKKAYENNCIKLYDTTGFCHVVKPKRLHFEGFTENFKWNYFLIELDKLDPIYEFNEFDFEYLVEDIPGNYVSAQYAQYGVYDYDTGIPLPKEYETVHRYNKGRLLIVMKDGPYNNIIGTYDGRHGDCSIDQFRIYINTLLSQYLNCYYSIKKNSLLNDLSEEDVEETILRLEYFNKNPFKKNYKNKNDSEITKEIEDTEKSKNYIKVNFLNFNFSKILSKDTISNSANIKFVFKFNASTDARFLDFLNDEHYYLCKDGYIKKINLSLNEKYYFLFDRSLAISMQNMLIERVNDILKQKNLTKLEEYEINFSIELIKNGCPQHLFTKEEIKDAMKCADDRFHNQLVIDENGYAKVIKDEGYGHLYPVSHESWDAGNMYVGKYSKLLSLEDSYNSSLQGWLSYLMSGEHQYMDYVQDNKNIEQILIQIEKYYKKM